ncbi:MAG: MBOAT family protein [Bacteroidales bacterium]|nr:MBOAT family protein [Bacteroidales bacterium]
MYFNSLTFAVFLPIVFCLYWFVFGRNLKWQNLFVLVASYVFYGWWDWRFLLLIALTSFCSFWSGILIGKYRDEKRKAGLVNTANILLNLGILGLFKYYNFFASSFAHLFLGGQSDKLLIHLILPVGISFYTFQALSYTIDVHRGKIEPTRDIVQFFAYVSFFPQLVAGPIERASNLLPQFARKRVFDPVQAADGLRMILWGLFKKVVVADQCARYVDQVFSHQDSLPGGTLILGVVLFTIQIYGDFSGYSDIAIGTSKLFGIKLMTNFRTPYFSRSIKEFWQRWHISLTTWLRDYVYFPLGGSRCSKAKAIRNNYIVFILCGLWHGASWTYIAWGVYFGTLAGISILYGKGPRYKDTVAHGKLFPSLKEAGLILWMNILNGLGSIFFRSETIDGAWRYFLGFFHWKGQFSGSGIMTPAQMTALFLASFVMFGTEWLNREKEHGLVMDGIKSRPLRWTVYLILMMAVILFFDDGTSPFVYFQF